jgi:hypothetical protein
MPSIIDRAIIGPGLQIAFPFIYSYPKISIYLCMIPIHTGGSISLTIQQKHRSRASYRSKNLLSVSITIIRSISLFFVFVFLAAEPKSTTLNTLFRLKIGAIEDLSLLISSDFISHLILPIREFGWIYIKI